MACEGWRRGSVVLALCVVGDLAWRPLCAPSRMKSQMRVITFSKRVLYDAICVGRTPVGGVCWQDHADSFAPHLPTPP